jgi:RNA polymerase sigma-70 factor (ECF subfamily)
MKELFTHIYDMYSKSLFSVINVLVSNRERTEDVLQVFVKMKIDSYNEVRTLLYVDTNIARNTSIDKLRSKNF